MTPNVLSIAGFDPSGGAGILADIKTFAAFKCHGLAVITALTVQNTQGVKNFESIPSEIIAAQIDALFADTRIAAVKIGMLASPRIAEVVAEKLASYAPPFVVLDPVLKATSGAPLAEEGLTGALVEHLAPRVTLLTPNIEEAAQLLGAALPKSLADTETLAKGLHQLGFKAVLIKGGHLDGNSADDLLFDGVSYQQFSARRVATRHAHGTGCTLSAAIAALRARDQVPLDRAILEAKTYVTAALEAADELEVGRGSGPLHHFHRFW